MSDTPIQTNNPMNWIKHLAICLPLTLLLVGCAPKEATKTETTETTETVEMANPPAETTGSETAPDTTTEEVKTEEVKTEEVKTEETKTEETAPKAQ